jgi:hypothetical protein
MAKLGFVWGGQMGQLQCKMLTLMGKFRPQRKPYKKSPPPANNAPAKGENTLI